MAKKGKNQHKSNTGGTTAGKPSAGHLKSHKSLAKKKPPKTVPDRAGTPAGAGEHAGEIYVQPDAPYVEPYLTPEQMMEYAEALAGKEERINALENSFNQSEYQTNFEQAELAKGELADTTHASEAYGGRGLFHSSIRDGDLADITATAELKKKYLSDQLLALKESTEGQITAINKQWNEVMEPEWNKIKVRNADETAEGIEPPEGHWEHDPNAPPPVTPPPKKKQHKKKKFVVSHPVPKTLGPKKASHGGTTAPETSPGLHVSVKPPKPPKRSRIKTGGQLYG